MPVRIQRKRTKGWKMPESAVYVGRPTLLGNPFTVKAGYTPSQAVELYRDFLLHCLEKTAPNTMRELLDGLRGKDLVCWCNAGAPCHADVLLELANAPDQPSDSR